jgi:hypothetical protein
MLLKHFWHSWLGRREWKKLVKKFGIKKKQIYVLLFPERDKDLNEQALIHLNDLIANRLAEGVVILSVDGALDKDVNAYSDKIIAIIKYPEKKAGYLLKYYTLYKFSEKFIIISLTRPEGNAAFKAIGINGVNIEDIVCLGLYKLRHVPAVRHKEKSSVY